jgi:hypothetical protein
LLAGVGGCFFISKKIKIAATVAKIKTISNNKKIYFFAFYPVDFSLTITVGKIAAIQIPNKFIAVSNDVAKGRFINYFLYIFLLKPECCYFGWAIDDKGLSSRYNQTTYQ